MGVSTASLWKHMRMRLYVNALHPLRWWQLRRHSSRSMLTAGQG